MLNPPPQPPLDRDSIAAYIPHQGDMCLLDTVEIWTATHIRCRSGSHRLPRNPLRSADRLGIACGVEYCAQAMAIHGALLGPQGGRPRLGYLVSVRGLRFGGERLDTIVSDLLIEAQRLSGDDNLVLYQFVLRGDHHTLLEGRAAVVLDADRL